MLHVFFRNRHRTIILALLGLVDEFAAGFLAERGALAAGFADILGFHRKGELVAARGFAPRLNAGGGSLAAAKDVGEDRLVARLLHKGPQGFVVLIFKELDGPALQQLRAFESVAA